MSKYLVAAGTCPVEAVAGLDVCYDPLLHLLVLLLVVQASRVVMANLAK